MKNSIVFDDDSGYSVKRIKISEANVVEDSSFEAIYELSNLLETGLDREILRILVNLCRLGVNPNSLVSILRRLIENRIAYATNNSKTSQMDS